MAKRKKKSFSFKGIFSGVKNALKARRGPTKDQLDQIHTASQHAQKQAAQKQALEDRVKGNKNTDKQS